jgi:hypothetical protein
VWSLTSFIHPIAYAFKQRAVERKKKDGRRKKERMKKESEERNTRGLFNEAVAQTTPA